jgi:DNA processing protein
MARGIDTAAHKGALSGNGRTIAILGTSLEIDYPAHGNKIKPAIVKSGCLISEFLPGTSPIGHNFPRRNRIISGLAQGVVVIEAAEQSGALSTVSHALAQNREVFAVPGPPRYAKSKGTNELIKQGARLLTSINDIFNELPRLAGNIKARRMTQSTDLTDTEKNIVKLFNDEPIHIDIIVRQTEIPLPELMPILLALELKGLIRELSGKRYILN